MKPTTLIDQKLLDLILKRLCHQLIENHGDFSNAVILGLQPRGSVLAERIVENLKAIHPKNEIKWGILDITFFRDDFRRRAEPLAPNATRIDFIIEGKDVIMVDDVLYTGRTIRAGLDAMLSYGRPKSVELLTLIERRFSRELPITPTYIGKKVDSLDSQAVKVQLGEEGKKDKVLLLNNSKDDE